jgi:hypothetical protein
MDTLALVNETLGEDARAHPLAAIGVTLVLRLTWGAIARPLALPLGAITVGPVDTSGGEVRASARPAPDVTFELTLTLGVAERPRALAATDATGKFEPVEAEGGDVRPSPRAGTEVTFELTVIAGATVRASARAAGGNEATEIAGTSPLALARAEEEVIDADAAEVGEEARALARAD